MTKKMELFRSYILAVASLRPTASRAIWLRGRSVLLLLPLLALMTCLVGCQRPRPVIRDTGTPAGTTPFASTKLQEGDVIRVTFEGQTNLNTVAKVQLDGSITMPLVGEVKAVGKTPQELQTHLTQRYEPLLKASGEITVALASTAASVYVSGAVLKPGRYPMDRPLTALDAIMEAGGVDNTRAKLSGVTILRLENGVQRYYRVNLKRTLQGADSSPFYLKPFDTVHVPEKTFNF